MPKYRLLTKSELLELEKEFVEYLILNGIHADDWERMKIQDTAKADSIVELFSDVVLESVLRKINFVEYRDKNSLRVFQCLETQLVAVSLTSEADDVDFTNQAFIQQAALNPPDSLKITTSSKPYKNVRETELFEMLQTGCTITDGTLFKTLCLMLPQ